MVWPSGRCCFFSWKNIWMLSLQAPLAFHWHACEGGQFQIAGYKHLWLMWAKYIGIVWNLPFQIPAHIHPSLLCTHTNAQFAPANSILGKSNYSLLSSRGLSHSNSWTIVSWISIKRWVWLDSDAIIVVFGIPPGNVRRMVGCHTTYKSTCESMWVCVCAYK